MMVSGCYRSHHSRAAMPYRLPTGTVDMPGRQMLFIQRAWQYSKEYRAGIRSPQARINNAGCHSQGTQRKKRDITWGTIRP